jgi:hypothetical protein
MNFSKCSHFFLVVIVAFGIAGCATPVHQMATQFNESEFERYALSVGGASTIRGQAFLKTRGGEVRFGAGEKVTLIPMTAYSREVWQASVAGKETKKDPRLEKYVRTTVADGNGNFEFSNLPVGDYFIECPIFWEVPNANSLFGISRTGALVTKEIQVNPQDNLKIILTQ